MMSGRFWNQVWPSFKRSFRGGIRFCRPVIAAKPPVAYSPLRSSSYEAEQVRPSSAKKAFYCSAGALLYVPLFVMMQIRGSSCDFSCRPDAVVFRRPDPETLLIRVSVDSTDFEFRLHPATTVVSDLLNTLSASDATHASTSDIHSPCESGVSEVSSRYLPVKLKTSSFCFFETGLSCVDGKRVPSSPTNVEPLSNNDFVLGAFGRTSSIRRGSIVDGDFRVRSSFLFLS